jgi:dipeptidyl aminopeptidase/acylaminoacyl peptidase
MPTTASDTSSVEGLRPEDVYELRSAGDPRLDPGGAVVAYTVTTVDREENDYGSSIWLAPVDGSAPPRRFTSGERRETSPRWSPEGCRLAFVARRGAPTGPRREDDWSQVREREARVAQLFVIPADGGEAIRLTDAKEDVIHPVWAPDGSRLAFATRVPDEAYDEEDDHRRKPRRITRLAYKLDNVGWTFDRRMQIFTVAADGSGEPVQLTSGEWESESPAWSPDGTRIAFTSGRGEDWDIDLVTDVYVMAADGGEPELLTDRSGTCANPVWSPDGTRIAFHWTPERDSFPRHTQIAVADVATRERTILTESLDLNCGPYPEIGEPIWDGDRIVFALESRGNTHLYAVSADGSAEPELLVGGEIGLGGYDLVAGTLVHTASTGTTMREVYCGERRLSDVGDELASARRLVEPERFTAVSPDGSEVDAWLVRPAGFEEGKRYPVLLSIHGGPFSQYPTSFFDEFQVLAGAGYAVLYANPRGSSGYSEAWGRAICGPLNGAGPGWGTVDYEDLMAVVDEALRRFDFLDGEHMGVLGGSYGGYMTSWIVSHTNRFKAACSERAVNHLLSAFGSSDVFWHFGRHFGGWPWEDADAWLEHSPVTYAHRIETPLLIVHSEQDLRCDVEQAEHLFITLRLMRKPVEMVRFPAESHELSRSGSPLHRVTRFETILDWFGRHLAH